LGSYRLVGRLGEGGMGTVFLAGSADGRQVALKAIRDELAHDAEFRRRFRREVAAARQVPPFCTAEVLDADTEHDPPFLVVEYVDGPSLSSVIADRGPLSPANQHGLAVGVAVALTAIHGAGVIHRDLKPGNVLLAPGSPKVIDFGIARDAAAGDDGTTNDQMVGTVAYMSPERFGPAGAIGPAADIFAWGAVVAFAATGRTPFAAETPAAMAVRIMSEPPDLAGLSGPLRELVELALDKDPARRPTARELVDRLLSGSGEATVPIRSAAFTEQAEVLAAAGLAPTIVGEGAAVTRPLAAVTRPLAPVTRPLAPVTRPQALVTRPRVPGGPTARPPAAERGRRGQTGGGRLAIGALAISVLLLAGAVAGMATGLVPWPRQVSGAATGAPSATTSQSSPAPPTTAAPAAWLDPAATLVIEDGLTAPGRWRFSEYADYNATCVLDGRLTVTLGALRAGSYRCRGVNEPLADFSVAVDVTLADDKSCAGVWFRFSEPQGYALRICQATFELMTHIGSELELRRTFYLPDSIDVGAPTRVAVKASGSTFSFFRDGALVGTYTDATFAEGKVVLGVFPLDSTVEPPFVVSFEDIELWRGPETG
jgi:hypothetical protein